MPEHRLLPLTLRRSEVMYVPSRQVQRSMYKGITLERVHLNTRIVMDDGQVRRRFWLPDAQGLRNWGWAEVPARSWVADAAPGWYWLRIKGEVDGQGGLTLYAFYEDGLMLSITPAA